jgi:hypothetical protein
MAYVDLNPIRAGIAETPEESSHTSVKQRVDALSNRSGAKKTIDSDQKVPEITDLRQHSASTRERGAMQNLRIASVLQKLTEAPLLPFEPTSSLATGIPFSFDDYLELVDSVGRVVHPNKRGYILEKTPAILTCLGIDADLFIDYADHFLKEFGSAVGTPEKLVELAAARQSRYLRGISTARAMFEGGKLVVG